MTSKIKVESQNSLVMSKKDKTRSDITKVKVSNKYSLCSNSKNFQIIRCFGFSTYITFTLYLDIVYKCIAKSMYLE
jgi:hypothetical protein